MSVNQKILVQLTVCHSFIMTTSLAFMITGRENKIEMNDVDCSKTIRELKSEIMNELANDNPTLKVIEQIRFIYSGKFLNDNDKVESIVKKDIEPPYTIQIMIRSESAIQQSEKQEEENKVEKKCCNIF